MDLLENTAGDGGRTENRLREKKTLAFTEMREMNQDAETLLSLSPTRKGEATERRTRGVNPPLTSSTVRPGSAKQTFFLCVFNQLGL